MRFGNILITTPGQYSFHSRFTAARNMHMGEWLQADML
jgi:hypothetical protein